MIFAVFDLSPLTLYKLQFFTFIIGIGRLVHWYQPIVVYTIGKYKYLLYGVSIVKIVMFERWVGHFERKFKGEWGVTQQRLLSSENRVPGLSRGVVCVILGLAILVEH